MLWQVITAANIAIAAAYFSITWIIFSGLRATQQLGTNKLATAASLIFFTCAVHHGSQAVHMLLPSFGVADAKGLALRDAWYWQTAVWDIFGALVAFYYLSLRGSYASVLRGAQMFEDFRVRQRQALEINDTIVQGLAVARMALEKGDDEDARVAIEDTLRRSQRLSGELLGSDDAEKIGSGDLRRSVAAGVTLKERPST